MTFMRLCAVATLAVAVATTSAAAKNPIVGGQEMFPSKNIIQNAVNSADHTTLVTQANVFQSNGVIHVIDSVVLPN